MSHNIILALGRVAPELLLATTW